MACRFHLLSVILVRIEDMLNPIISLLFSKPVAQPRQDLARGCPEDDHFHVNRDRLMASVQPKLTVWFCRCATSSRTSVLAAGSGVCEDRWFRYRAVQPAGSAAAS
jgi:hypothetical protein